MIDQQFPKFMELEYSFNLGGHNSLKFVDGRLFFFSEADSHLSEKNEYITMVSIPEENKWKRFWDDLIQCRVWDWDECQWNSEVVERSSVEKNHVEEHCHCEDDNCECDSENEHIPPEEDTFKEDENLSKEDFPQEDKIPIEGDIWQVKIIKDDHRISCKSWCLKQKSTDEFFQAIKKLTRVDVTEPFVKLSKRFIDE